MSLISATIHYAFAQEKMGSLASRILCSGRRCTPWSGGSAGIAVFPACPRILPFGVRFAKKTDVSPVASHAMAKLHLTEVKNAIDTVALRADEFNKSDVLDVVSVSLPEGQNSTNFR